MAGAGDVMADRVACEFLLLRWVPDVVRGEFANVGVILREARPEGRMLVRFARSWRRVRAVDPGVDAGLLEEIAEELAQRLPAVMQDGGTRPLLEVLRSSFSNGLQVTEPRACLAETLEAEMGRLLAMYVEPIGVTREARVLAAATGRAAIVRGMRREFEGAGVWALLRKGIAAAEYTGVGDRLRIDCGYEAGAEGGRAVRMFQAVSLMGEVDGAKVLAFSAARLREGVRRVDGVELVLTAVVEPGSAVGVGGGLSLCGVSDGGGGDTGGDGGRDGWGRGDGAAGVAGVGRRAARVVGRGPVVWDCAFFVGRLWCRRNAGRSTAFGRDDSGLVRAYTRWQDSGAR